MSGFQAEIDPHAQKAADEAASGGDGRFPPLPGGRYQATIVKIVKIEKFGGDGGNADKKVLRIQVRILEGSPVGAKRTYFVRVPLFSRYAPTQKNPEGAVARMFWDFWERAIGVPRDQILAGNLPDNFQGKQVTITLGAPKPPDQYNELGFNEVDFFNAAENDFSSTPTVPVNVPWLDEKGNRIAFAGAPAAPGVQAPPAAPAAPPSWAPSAPASGAPAAPSAPPAAATPAQGAPPAWTPDPADAAYAQQQAPAAPQADPALQAAAAATTGF